MWKNPENLTENQQAKLAWVAATDPRLHRAYLLKEGLRVVFQLPYDEAVEALDRWISWARRCRIPAFVKLQGNDVMLSPAEMQQFEDFLATLTFPPNPFRNLDNSLPTNLPLPGHYTSGRFAPAGQPLPNGNAVAGLAIFRPPRLLALGLFAG